ncbi:hypothetical protein DBR46_23980 [Pseudomonas sp. KBW05]|nr:hypothetical protein DBR46_23980 [Pseudomonas sp. KBW05]
MWERACSRKRSVSRCMYQLTDCIREQARSHICFAASLSIAATRIAALLAPRGNPLPLFWHCRPAISPQTPEIRAFEKLAHTLL